MHSVATPLADDSLPALLAFYGPMFAAWGIAGFWQGRKTALSAESSAAGAAISFGTFTSYDSLVLVRVNVFLDQLRGRDDWQSLISRFPTSGFERLPVVHQRLVRCRCAVQDRGCLCDWQRNRVGRRLPGDLAVTS